VKVHVRHVLKADAAAAFALCTEQKNQASIYAQLGGSEVVVKRQGRAPNVKLAITRKEPSSPPAAIARFVPGVNTVQHTEAWSRDGEGYRADIVVDIKGVPVKITGTKSLVPGKGTCTVEWHFNVTSGIPLLGGLIASFAGSEVERKLKKEATILSAMT
jgi:hypothetical protein